MTRRGGAPRPSKAAGPIVGSVFALSLWALVAHNSGSGWVQALGCLLAGFVAVGLLGPAVASARLTVAVESNPVDANAGHPVTIVLSTNGPVRVESVTPAGAAPAFGSGRVPIEVVPARRGPLLEATLLVSSAAPFGLVWWRKKVVVPLVRPLWIAPEPRAPDLSLLAPTANGGALERPHPRDGRFGEPRGVRPYETGDPRRSVHWPASAHRGELMVREAERPDAAIPEVRVVLPDNGPAGDAFAGRALGTVLSLLERSSPVMVSTTEREGPKTEPVYGPLDARRRLARAVAGGPAR